MHRTSIFVIVGISILLMSHPDGYADSPSEMVDKGNAAYLAGKYDEALSAYEEASVEAPESPPLYFNKGAALYQKGDYAGASEAFEKAALKSKDMALEVKSKFNLGNCAFREAERQQDSDLNKAMEACAKSIRHYQEALGLDPGFHEAAKNIEVVRLVMKNILDEINKQKEARQRQQEAQQKIADRLKELIQRQQDLLERNQQIEDVQGQKGHPQNLGQKIRDLAQDQRNLQTETENLAKNMAGCQNDPNTRSPAEIHVNNAAKEQSAASGNLEQQNTSAAKTNQEKALKELKDALTSLGEGQKEGGKKQDQQQGQQQQTQQQGGEQQREKEQQQQASSAGHGPQEKEGEKGDAAMAQVSEDAKDILDEEKENKNQRRLQAQGGYMDVDKDW